MPDRIDRRDFVRVGLALGVAASTPGSLAGLAPNPPGRPEAAMLNLRTRARPVVIADRSGYHYRNGGPENAVERAFRGLVEGEDPLDALVAGANIPELDPEETGIGYGGLPNADGVVQLDASVMHGPLRRAGAVAALEGVRTPSMVARAVMHHTDHHLLVGQGAQDFARQMGFEIEDDLNTPRSRELWLEWKRRVDPEHWLDPGSRERVGAEGGGSDPRLADRGYRAGRAMVREGLIPEHGFWGTVNLDGVAPNGDICGVTTTSGLAWKIPGRAGDSPILGAGLYVDNDVGAAGSTGRGEANLYNLSSFLIVEHLRRGMAPADAGMAALRRIRDNTVEARLLDDRGRPDFNVRFFVVDKTGAFAGVSMYATGEAKYAVCTENGSELRDLEPLLEAD